MCASEEVMYMCASEEVMYMCASEEVMYMCVNMIKGMAIYLFRVELVCVLV